MQSERTPTVRDVGSKQATNALYNRGQAIKTLHRRNKRAHYDKVGNDRANIEKAGSQKQSMRLNERTVLKEVTLIKNGGDGNHFEKGGA